MVVGLQIEGWCPSLRGCHTVKDVTLCQTRRWPAADPVVCHVQEPAQPDDRVSWPAPALPALPCPASLLCCSRLPERLSLAQRCTRCLAALQVRHALVRQPAAPALDALHAHPWATQGAEPRGCCCSVALPSLTRREGTALIGACLVHCSAQLPNLRHLELFFADSGPRTPIVSESVSPSLCLQPFQSALQTPSVCEPPAAKASAAAACLPAAHAGQALHPRPVHPHQTGAPRGAWGTLP